MAKKHILRSLPGWLAAFLALVVTTVLCYVGTASMFYETWGQPFHMLLYPLVPGMACLALSLAALRWPRAGGWLLVFAGAAMAAWWLTGQLGSKTRSLQFLLLNALVLFAPIVATGCLFLLEAWRLRRLSPGEVQPPGPWIVRYLRYILVSGVPLLAIGIVMVMELPAHLARLDDGLRGARIIEGNGVTLAWAPKGPGWNGKMPDGEYLSWNSIARYGSLPIGLEGKNRGDRQHAGKAEMDRTSLCAYLNEEGTALLEEPRYIWRMPTVDEIVRSLTRNGKNAGCLWDEKTHHADCRISPDKETPLWAPDEATIYYLAAGEYDAVHAFCVNYTGGINIQPKSQGMGFRCVKDITAEGSRMSVGR